MTLQQIADNLRKLIEVCNEHDEFVLNSRQSGKLTCDGQWTADNAFTVDLHYLDDIALYLSALDHIDNKMTEWLQDNQPMPQFHSNKADVEYYAYLLKLIEAKIKQGYTRYPR